MQRASECSCASTTANTSPRLTYDRFAGCVPFRCGRPSLRQRRDARRNGTKRKELDQPLLDRPAVLGVLCSTCSSVLKQHGSLQRRQHRSRPYSLLRRESSRMRFTAKDDRLTPEGGACKVFDFSEFHCNQFKPPNLNRFVVSVM